MYIYTYTYMCIYIHLSYILKISLGAAFILPYVFREGLFLFDECIRCVNAKMR